jgi:putative PEP-CTERM system histidine kinase
MSVTAVSYIVCAGAYLVAAALLLRRNGKSRQNIVLLGACVLTAIWAGAISLGAIANPPSALLSMLMAVLEQLHAATWIGVAALAILLAYRTTVEWRVRAGLMAVTAAAMLFTVAVTLMGTFGRVLPVELVRASYLANVMVSVVALLLIENLFRNAEADTRWSAKYLCFGLGIVFIYDFFLYAQAALLGQLDPNGYAARGAVNAIAVAPIFLFAARSSSSSGDVQISRKLVFHTATLLAAGAYLIVMALVGYSLRAFDSPWGAVSQALFLFAALLVLAVLLASGEMQARLKAFISQHILAAKYDYRTEWPRFVERVTDSGTDLSLPERVVRSLADIIDSPGGYVWVRDRADAKFQAAGSWNMGHVPLELPADERWIEALSANPGIIGIKSKDVDGTAPFTAELPAWLSQHPRALIIVPLVHAQVLIGIVVLCQLRAPRRFDWEDYKLLKTAARQAASYVAEDYATQALARARRFEEFNQRFAFIVHDVKNLSAQMTLILKNAERHGDNREFQQDVLKTIGQSAVRLRGMLERLGKSEDVTAAEPVNLTALLDEVADEWRLQLPNLQACLPPDPIHVVGRGEQLRAVIGHLIQNAADAAGEKVNIEIGLHIEGVNPNRDGMSAANENWWAVVTVSDDGPGMDRRFIETNLFQPLKSTKSNGFGIGAFQARQMTRDMGGFLEVDSQRGCGTIVTLRLPFVRSTELQPQKAAASSYPQPIHALKIA